MSRQFSSAGIVIVIRLTYGSWPGVGGNDQTVADFERRRVREERRRVAVRPEPVQDQVEGDAAHFLLIGSSGLLGVVLAPDAMHRGGSLLYAVEQ